MTAEDIIFELKQILSRHYYHGSRDYMNGSLEFAGDPTKEIRKLIKRYKDEKDSKSNS